MTIKQLERLILKMGKKLVNYKNLLCTEMYESYNNLTNILTETTKDLYVKYSDKKGKLDIRKIYRTKRIEVIMKQVEGFLKPLGQMEIDLVEGGIKKVSHVDYGLCSYMLSMQANGIILVPPIIPKDIAEDLMNLPWSDDRYQDRVWHNKTILKSKIRRELTSCVVTGTPFSTAVKKIRDVVSVEAYKAERLVRSEVMAASNRAHKSAIQKFQEKYGKFNLLEGVKVLETLDNKTCNICKSMDGKIFPYEEMHKVKDIEHPNCRRRILPVIKGFSEDKITRAARDKEGKTYRTSARTYKEYAEEQGIEYQY